MKITKRQLKRIIKEERTKILKEGFSDEHDPETGERDQYEQDPQMQQVQDEIYDLAKREVGVGLDELEDMFGGMGIDAAMQAEQNGLIFMDNEVFYASGSHMLSPGPQSTRSYMGEGKITKSHLKEIIKEATSMSFPQRGGDTLAIARELEAVFYNLDDMLSGLTDDALISEIEMNRELLASVIYRLGGKRLS